jgi:hypothetical protein
MLPSSTLDPQVVSRKGLTIHGSNGSMSAKGFHIIIKVVLVLHLKGATSVFERFTLGFGVYNHE